MPKNYCLIATNLDRVWANNNTPKKQHAQVRRAMRHQGESISHLEVWRWGHYSDTLEQELVLKGRRRLVPLS